MQADDPLFKRMLGATAPLLLWAAHFAFLYVFVAIACIAGVAASTVAGVPVLTAVLLLESAAAIAAAAVMLTRSARLLRRRGNAAGLFDVVRAGSALMAVFAIAWVSLPVMFLRTCN